MRTLLLFALIAAEALCQDPTSSRGENVSDYNIVNSFETGYRFATVGGNQDTYRSNVNYGNGIRLLNSYFTVNSRDGHGLLFDEIVLTTNGLGNDPYESSTLRIQKNRLYRYDLTWRLNDYFNPGLVTDGSAGLHFMNTRYTAQDQDLTLFPQSNIKFFLGYSRGSQSGPAISTIQGPGAAGDNVFPVFADVRRKTNEYRVGNEFKVFGIRVNWMHGWQDYKEDTPFFLSFLTPGNNPLDPTRLSAFNRSAPYHGTSPYWRVGVFSGNKWVAFNGRFTYTAGRRAFVLDESAVGVNNMGTQNRQIVTLGTGQRPAVTGSASISFTPTDKLSIVNSTSVHNIRTEGESSYVQFDNSSQSANYLSFQYLGIRTVSNDTDVNYAWKKWLGFFAGYHYTDRRITSILFPGMDPYRQTNILSSGIFGFRLRPVQGLTMTFDGEVGRVSQPFAPASEKNVHDLAGRIDYKHKSLHLQASTRENYNVNSTSVTSYSSHARSYAADAAWTPRNWLTFDAGYTKQHLNSLAGLAYFVNRDPISGEDSIYISNLHVVNAGIRFAMGKRLDLYVAYNRIQDTGDGRDTVTGTIGGASLPALQAAQTFPLTFHAPMGKLSFKVAEKIWWNVAYEYYGYHERFYSADNYRANTGYTSLVWSF